MRKTKIVCAIGPASEDLDTLKAMLRAGMNVARLNFPTTPVRCTAAASRPFAGLLKRRGYR